MSYPPCDTPRMKDNLSLEPVDYGTGWQPAASIRPIRRLSPVEYRCPSYLPRYPTKNLQKMPSLSRRQPGPQIFSALQEHHLYPNRPHKNVKKSGETK